MFWHSLGWRNISLLYWMDLKICFSLHSIKRNHTIHCSFCALSQYGVSFDGVGSFIIGQLRSFDVIRPRLSRPSHSRDLKIVQWWENGPIWVLLPCLCLYSAPHLVTRSIDPDFTKSGLPNLVPSTFFRNNWACLPSWITHCSECNLYGAWFMSTVVTS